MNEYLKKIGGIAACFSQFHAMGSNVSDGDAVQLCVFEDFVTHFASKEFQVGEMPKNGKF